MKILLGGAQDIGKREDQQDSFYISDSASAHAKATGLNLLVVCDGIGVFFASLKSPVSEKRLRILPVTPLKTYL